MSIANAFATGMLFPVGLMIVSVGSLLTFFAWSDRRHARSNQAPR